MLEFHIFRLLCLYVRLFPSRVLRQATEAMKQRLVCVLARVSGMLSVVPYKGHVIGRSPLDRSCSQ